MADLRKEWDSIQKDIVDCKRCPRLRKYCLKVAAEKKRAHFSETYWGLPVPSLGDGASGPKLWIIGLAPAAHGGNRTGRMFTGDRSGEWLYRALFEHKFANQSTYTNSHDGLKLISTVISATARCAPPDNRPTKEEMAHCSEYLQREWQILKPTCHTIIMLGKIAHDHTWRLMGLNPPIFKHGFFQKMEIDGVIRTLISSFHPSQQNTFTGRLTKPMFDLIFAQAMKTDPPD